jgi:hypothetical protein
MAVGRRVGRGQAVLKALERTGGATLQPFARVAEIGGAAA